MAFLNVDTDQSFYIAYLGPGAQFQILKYDLFGVKNAQNLTINQYYSVAKKDRANNKIIVVGNDGAGNYNFYTI